MQIHQVIQTGLNYAQNNPAAAVAAGIIFLYLLMKAPKLLLTLTFIGFAAMGAMHLFDKLSSTGLGGN